MFREDSEPDNRDNLVGELAETPKETEGILKLIHRGVWADKLIDGQELPVGGSMFSNELTTKLKLDFESFDCQNFTEDNICAAYEKSKSFVIDWLKQVGSNVDPYIYFVCFNVQKKVDKLLETDSIENNHVKRLMEYKGGKTPKLSELKGKTECAERAALGQYLLQKSGLISAYVSGMAMENPKDLDDYPENHSYIVVNEPLENKETLIFDIARPIKGKPDEGNIARVLRTDVSFDYELLKDKEEIFVGAIDVLQQQKLWYGVGDPVSGTHNFIDK